MLMKDQRALVGWLNGASLNEVESTARIGAVENERFTERARDWYRFIWTWGTWRFSSTVQDRAWKKLGHKRFLNRINRVRRFSNKHFGTNYEMYPNNY